jgi:hypothetical protein
MLICFHNKLCYVLAPFLTLAQMAVAQAISGTVITIFHSPEEVVLAADGRGNHGTATSVTNNECKLIPLDKALISGFGGVTGFQRINHRCSRGCPACLVAARSTKREMVANAGDSSGHKDCC